MRLKVLDSWALMALFNNEPAAGAVEDLLVAASEGKHHLLFSVINWGEVYYAALRAGGETLAEARVAEIASLPIEIIGVGDDLKLVRLAAAFKARGGLSYADAFCAALAREKKADVVTGDPEFKALEREVKVQWLK
jgi:uncharacterized protein